MPSFLKIEIHPTQFPEHVHADLRRSLRERKMAHKFHYDTIKQAQKWLALHDAYSPARTDSGCTATYDLCFQDMAAALNAPSTHVLGLGCGGGQKDVSLLRTLNRQGRLLYYTPCDVSTALAIVAHQAAASVIPATVCGPRVCDFESMPNLNPILEDAPTGTSRLITFFGMLPNFEPHSILPKLRALISEGDRLLLSANLAPGPDYATGIQKILPQYDNVLTRDWLLTVLLDLGLEANDGEVTFSVEVENSIVPLRRVVAHFHFTRPRQVKIQQEQFSFSPGECIRLFFSYRHTPALLKTLLESYGFRVVQDWITPSEEEGLFLVSG